MTAHRRTRGHPVAHGIATLAMAAAIFLPATLTAQASYAKKPPPMFGRIEMPGDIARVMIHRAIQGATSRLTDPICQELFTDFQDADGRPLLDKLDRLKKTPANYLADVWFVDARDSPQCKNTTAAAFTSPGARVVYICGLRFAESRSALQGAQGDLVIIHEVLHTLGLGENPPSSAAITWQVMKRCNR